MSPGQWGPVGGTGAGAGGGGGERGGSTGRSWEDVWPDLSRPGKTGKNSPLRGCRSQKSVRRRGGGPSLRAVQTQRGASGQVCAGWGARATWCWELGLLAVSLLSASPARSWPGSAPGTVPDACRCFTHDLRWGFLCVGLCYPQPWLPAGQPPHLEGSVADQTAWRVDRIAGWQTEAAGRKSECGGRLGEGILDRGMCVA